MTLTSGARIGPYEVVSPLGVGGMGEVYRATDINLARPVAIKVLPDAVASDADRLARFDREAKTLAALNHPNIAAIYGLERTDGRVALVMELVEGPTLADRIAEGPIPVDEARPIATQIAEALEAAHEQGIIHRDLKPANIKVRQDGTVKVLDFGLAKAMAPASAPSLSPSMSPTITTPAMTQAGLILGTAAYMSPEQAKGRPADRRSDLWSFGCVLFEMLTGRRAFPGEDVSDTLALVLRGEPEWSALPTDTPAALRRLLRRCLMKDRRGRLGDMRTAVLEIADAGSAADAQDEPAAAPRTRIHVVLMLASAVAGAALAAAASWALWPAPADPPDWRFAIELPAGQTLVPANGPGIVVSRDGSVVAYTARDGENARRIFLRRRNQAKVEAVEGSEGGYAPFFSPDDREVGFFAEGKLWRAPVAGGMPFQITVVDRTTDRGAAWGPDGFVYIGTQSGIARVALAGGARKMLTRVDPAAGEIAHRFPDVLPDGRALVYTSLRGALEQSQVVVLDLSTKATRVAVESAYGGKIANGHLLFLRAGALMAVPLDRSGLDVVGTPQPLLNEVDFNNGGASHFSISTDGMLVFLPVPGPNRVTPVWADGAGNMTPVGIAADSYLDVVPSPVGGRLALVVRRVNGGSDIVIWDDNRRSLSSLTRDSAFNEAPVWMPDGDTIVFASRRGGIGSPAYLFRARVNGEQPEPISPLDIAARSGSAGQFPASATASDVFFAQVGSEQGGLYALNLKTAQARMIRKGGFQPRISPDRRWLAYVAAGEVWVEPYPVSGEVRWQVSTNGATAPRWSRDGDLLFRAGSALMVARADPRKGFASVRPRRVFDASETSAEFGLSPDGRVLLLRTEMAEAPVPQVIVDWRSELQRRAPGP
jgi:serine/threonine-protein kinase